MTKTMAIFYSHNMKYEISQIYLNILISLFYSFRIFSGGLKFLYTQFYAIVMRSTDKNLHRRWNDYATVSSFLGHWCFLSFSAAYPHNFMVWFLF